jgi:carboxylesterase
MSLGSLLALLLAADRREDVAALVCAGTPLKLADRRTALLRSLHWLPAMRRRFAVLPKGGRDISDPVARAASRTYDVMPLPALLELLELRRVARRALRSVVQPALVLHGRHDHNAPVANVALLRRRLGSHRIETHVLERSWHVVTEDVERDLVARLTIDFLERLEAR